MKEFSPLVVLFVGLSLMSSVSAPELSIIITAFVLALFGWKLWLLCNALAWWTVWDFIVTSSAFTRSVLLALGMGPWFSSTLAPIAVVGGIVLFVLGPSFAFSRLALRNVNVRIVREKLRFRK